MTRLGWVILGIIVGATAIFVSLTRFEVSGGGIRIVRAVPAAAPFDHSPESLAVPVAGVPRGALRDSWGDPRGGGVRGHHGTDIMAARGTPVVAAAAGEVEKLFQSVLGGTTLYLRSRDRRWIYYYAHLAGYAPGIHEGQRVAKGERIAFVGDTGDAGPGNYHLHFGMQRMRPDERWYQGEDVDPYPMLVGNGVGR